jgi:hypothetical protein
MSRWPRGTLYPQKLALTSPTSGGSSVGIVRSRTQATECLFRRATSRTQKSPPSASDGNSTEYYRHVTELHYVSWCSVGTTQLQRSHIWFCHQSPTGPRFDSRSIYGNNTSPKSQVRTTNHTDRGHWGILLTLIVSCVGNVTEENWCVFIVTSGMAIPFLSRAENRMQ